MSMDIQTTLFDTWQPSTTASTESLLFQVGEGADATHTETFTNMRGNGQLPSQEKFALMRLFLMLDEGLTEADLFDDIYGCLIEIRINDKEVFACPARMLYAYSAFGGHFTQAAGANSALIGPNGDGKYFDPPLMIDGGKRFAIRAKQGTAFTAARDIKVVLEGVLTLPD